jgi:hypothetical protein
MEASVVETALVTTGGELTMSRPPETTLREAERVAEVLATQLFKKIPPPTINGKKYPTVEHWTTAASFFGVFTRITEVRHEEINGVSGFVAVAEATSSEGNVISRAEAMCMTDEPRWAGRPLHQIRSMAQTRATSRVLRNIFSRIMVLAGCEATPAEDADGTWDRGEVHQSTTDAPKVNSASMRGTVAQPQTGQFGEKRRVPGKKISEPQRKRLYAISKGAGWTEQNVKDYIYAIWGIEHTADILMDNYDEVCDYVQNNAPDGA